MALCIHHFDDVFGVNIMPTAIVFAAIPVSVIGTFVAIAALAYRPRIVGWLVFAGMVVDASIVSLENRPSGFFDNAALICSCLV